MGFLKRKRSDEPIELSPQTTVSVHSEAVDVSKGDLGEQIRHTLEEHGIEPGQNRVVDASSITGLTEEIMGALNQSGVMAQAFGTMGGAMTELGRPTGPDPVAQLAQLAELHKKGVLSDYEFAEAKEKILNQSWKPPAG